MFALYIDPVLECISYKFGTEQAYSDAVKSSNQLGLDDRRRSSHGSGSQEQPVVDTGEKEQPVVDTGEIDCTYFPVVTETTADYSNFEDELMATRMNDDADHNRPSEVDPHTSPCYGQDEEAPMATRPSVNNADLSN